MIKNYRSKALRRFSEKGDRSKLPAEMVAKIARTLAFIDAMSNPKELLEAGFKYHALTEKMKGRHSVWITGNYRLTFGWDGKNATEVDLEDYH